ncbi:alpha/beta hydrolase fold-1 [Kribbella flavida DSM 17836]|uniref:Alpha/beta hydrolase fold-1 n=1 Tax=Kribbella flavida (strain DSM 17836 / JCM 10339 / NBRC 14399) TaxID=479435 RepID=D2PSA8_KRIFD|nr:alpha/beta hydrolase [Kribbella flavida]ADB31232.1 alpha/beta hydrolase fold-1 [Kribbella flavida DSM 17836]
MDEVISADSTAIAYDTFGAGPALVLVAGAMTDRSYYVPRATVLAEVFTVVTYDRRGRGDSGDQPQYAVEREVEDLEAVRMATGATYGYADSSGAMVLLRAAAAGSAFDRLAIMEPPFRVDGAPAAPDRYLERLQEFVAAGDPSGAAELFMVEAVGQPQEQVDGMKSMPFWKGMEAVAPTLVYDALQLGDSQVPTALLAGIEQPTLALHSTASPEWLQRATVEAADALPNARVAALEGSFHEVPPEVLLTALREHFLG